MNGKNLSGEEHFAQLRMYLTTPSHESWLRMHELLKRWPDESVQVAIDYAKEHLDSWDLELRKFLADLRTFDKKLPPNSSWYQLSTYLSLLVVEEKDFRIVENVANCKHFRVLQILKVFCYDSVDACVMLRSLSQAKSFHTLKELRLSEIELEGVDVSSLAESNAFPMLERLFLDNNKLNSFSAKKLANSTAFPMLRELHLGLNMLEGEGVKALCHSTTLANLEYLDLRANMIGDVGAKALARTKAFPRLSQLNLSFNGILATGARALVRSELVKKLDRLDLTSTKCTQRTLEKLIEECEKRKLNVEF